MFPSRCLLPLFLLLSAPYLRAQDGQQLYALYCSACHGADGKGATGGAFPPLAGSEWVHGNPKRSVAIVLKGLHGPIEVGGKAYNLEMPPQGAVLGDDQIVAILNFIHNAWGNKGQEVKRDHIRVMRSEFESRTGPWTGPELLKLFPLEKKATALTNLTSRVYKGQWNQMPDFTKIQAENVEEEHDGILDTALAALKEDFGIVWEGDFMAPADGEYAFLLDSDDGARLILKSHPVAEVKGLGPMGGKRASEGKVALKAGANPVRIEYFQGRGNQGISLGWKIAGAKQWQWLSAAPPKSAPGVPPIPLVAKDGRTVIYRNFIEGSTPRGIGFGFPGGVNMVYSADNLAPELIWAGAFIDAGRHWTNRGQGFQPPLADEVVKLTNQRFLPAEAVFKGYSLDKQGNPTFHVSIKAVDLTDSWKPGETGTLIRTLSVGSKAGVVAPMDIPLGNAEVTGTEKVTVARGKPVTVTYKLN
jgi:mono/diheme cytochrome c family protein